MGERSPWACLASLPLMLSAAFQELEILLLKTRTTSLRLCPGENFHRRAMNIVKKHSCMCSAHSSPIYLKRCASLNGEIVGFHQDFRTSSAINGLWR